MLALSAELYMCIGHSMQYGHNMQFPNEKFKFSNFEPH